MNDNPITLEADERGFILTVNLGEADLREGIPLGGDRFAFRLGTTGALALYEHVEATLGEWAREGQAARRAVAAGVTLTEYARTDRRYYDEPIDSCRCADYSLDPSDPKHPDYADRLSGAADHERKARRENG